MSPTSKIYRIPTKVIQTLLIALLLYSQLSPVLYAASAESHDINCSQLDDLEPDAITVNSVVTTNQHSFYVQHNDNNSNQSQKNPNTPQQRAPPVFSAVS